MDTEYVRFFGGPLHLEMVEVAKNEDRYVTSASNLADAIARGPGNAPPPDEMLCDQLTYKRVRWGNKDSGRTWSTFLLEDTFPENISWEDLLRKIREVNDRSQS